MFTDRYYTSLVLAEELAKMKCHLTGTIKTNRKGVPITFKTPKFGNKKTLAYRKNNNIILAWKDKRVVTMLTNWCDAGGTIVKRFQRGGVEIAVNKPNVVLKYIKFMGGVDRADQYTSTYCFLRKSLKWWRKLFFWGLEICVINSYILYKVVKRQRNEIPMSHLKYLKLLVKQLRGDYRQDRGPGRSSTSAATDDSVRLNGKLHIILKGTKKDCRVCSDRKKKGGRHETVYFCNTCPDKPRLDLGECFLKYHTMENFKE